MTNKPSLKVDALSTRFRLGKELVTVVDDVSFDLHAGKTVALVGESGCGKTVTALSLLRILPQIAEKPIGKVIYGGENLLEMSEKRLRSLRGGKIAMIFQDPSTALNPVYTIGDQLNEVAELHLGLKGEAAFLRAIAALNEVGISSPEERFCEYPHQMSGGMKQRVMIAMALMAEPDILIADEPTTALDVTIQAQVLDLMRALQQKKGMALLLITHDLGVVAEMADDVIVMYAAQEVERGSVTDIFDHPQHPYTQGLFASLPKIDSPKEKLKTIKGSVPSLGNYPTGCHFHPRCPHVMPKCQSGHVPLFTPKHKQLAKCWLYETNS